MSWTLTLSLCAAVLIFWAVGAYNRLMRLRTGVGRSFQALHAQLQQQMEPLQTLLAEPGALAEWPVPVRDARAGLRGALDQFSASLNLSRLQPMDRDVIQALGAAEQVLHMSWQRLCDADPAPLGSPQDGHRLTWETRQHQTTLARAAFAQSVADYNAAIGQFPASLLAWVFGFVRAAAL
jgi:LemA protein